MISSEDLQILDELAFSTCDERRVPLLVLFSESQEFNGNDPEKLFIRCSLETDEEGPIEGALVKTVDEMEACSNLVFSLGLIDFHLVAVNDGERPMIQVIAKCCQENVEWRSIVQLRIHACVEEGMWELVDADVVEFGNRVPPFVIHVNDYNIAKIKISLRYVYKMFDPLPDFSEGDLLVKFSDTLLIHSSSAKQIKTYKTLLQMHSPVLTSVIQKSGKSDDPDVLTIDCCDEHCFRELLYQIYPTQRPIYADFRALSIAAVALRANLVLDKLFNYLLTYDHLGFQSKIEEAAKLGLDEAIHKLVYDCAKSGQWSFMINAGFDPKAVFSHEIYFSVICPALAEALLDPSPFPCQLKPGYDLDFENPSLAENPSSVHLKVQGKSFYVSKGILQIHNDSMFGRGDKGEYFINMTLELRNALEESQIQMVDLVKPLLLRMCGQNGRLRSEFIHPSIVFAVAHQMPYLKHSLEDLLLMEPPVTPEKLLNHLQWAKNYDLKNLLRTTLFRVEGSYREVALALLQLPVFEKLEDGDIRRSVLDRLCSGWAAFGDCRLRKDMPTRMRLRQITSSAGGPVLQMDESELHTLLEADDNVIYDKEEELRFISQ